MLSSRALPDYAKTDRFTISVAAIAVLPGSAGGREEARTLEPQSGRCRDDIPPAGSARPAALAVRLQGPGGAGKFLGELVSALRPRNARPCPAATAAGGQAVSGSGAECGRKKIPGQEIRQTDRLRTTGPARHGPRDLQRMARRDTADHVSYRRRRPGALPRPWQPRLERPGHHRRGRNPVVRNRQQPASPPPGTDIEVN